ncbi:Cytochrome P450 [Mycena venus]|uniref:Cytochrome P450 n=1 Tax=Mycena venus TaxID=2733690 RepID=A0A8H6XCL9_9AGAR|nr:Cytochrome P450 [Mycena venus]
MLHYLTLLDIAFLFLGVFCVKRLLRSRGAPLPPGPRPWFGFLAFPSRTDKEWVTYGKWTEKWGDITSVTAFGQTVVVVNSLKTAMQILDKKSSNYSDRPVFQMCGELVGWTLGLVLISARTPQFRWTRKNFHQLIGSQANVKKFHPLEVEEYRKFLQRLLESPEQFRSHIHLTSGAIGLRFTYGYTVQGENDPIINLVNKVMEEFSESITPGAFLVDLLPMCKYPMQYLKYVPSWMPGAGFQIKAKLWSKHRSEMLDKPFKLVEEQLALGSAESSFVSILLRQNISKDEVTYLKWAAGSIYGGATDTTASAVSTFFLQMTLHPEIQAKAQAELDAVVGNCRLPGYDDRECLPYIDALVKEVFRFHPIAPMGKSLDSPVFIHIVLFLSSVGLPHRAAEDDIHNGYLIPKGSLVLANIWNMAHDPEVYADPLAFNPSRFIASDEHTPEPDPRDFIFGFGRRVCPGKLIADASVFIACAMTLATFTISKAVKNGKTIQPVEDYQSGTISSPAPFVCSIKPRSAEAVALIL